MNENLATNLTEAAAKQPDAAALTVGRAVTTYAQLDQLSAQVAAALNERGIGPGDRVGIMLPNVPEFAIAYYGTLRAGAVVVPMNPLLKAREVNYYLTDSDAKLLFAWTDFIAPARAGAAEAGVEAIEVTPGYFTAPDGTPTPTPVERAPDDTAVILYTSGTTGKPKGAQLTHANLKLNTAVSIETLITVGPGDVVLGALPMFHAFGQTCGLNAAIAAGATLALVPRFDPKVVLDTIEQQGVTVFEGVPTMYAALLNHRDRANHDVSSLRLCVSGGAALPVEILHGFEAAFGCVILEGYGLSETSPVACFNHPGGERLPGSIGTPIRGVEMRVVDAERKPVQAGETGEIAIRGHNIMKGYLNRPEATAEAIDADGWFYTGDIGRTDDRGRYFIVDRKKELIIRGGFNIYPREIEEVLYEHPAIREAAVIGIPHAELGEEVGAAVALKPGTEATEAEIRDFVKSHVAAYKYPRVVWFLAELPKGPTGKIMKREITPPVTTTTTAKAVN